jgi:hypothetical protein
VYLLANILFVYGGYNAIRRFCDDVERGGFEVPYDFHAGTKDFILHGHQGLKLLGAIDPYDSAAHGRQLGWKRDWCPFRNNAELLWYAGWDGADINAPDMVRACKNIAQVMVMLE